MLNESGEGNAGCAADVDLARIEGLIGEFNGDIRTIAAGFAPLVGRFGHQEVIAARGLGERVAI